MAQAAFLEWLRKSGAYVSPKLDLFGPGEGDDRTVRAREAVDEGERLLLVPEEATLTLGRGEGAMGSAGSLASQAPAAAYLSESHPTLSPFMRTVLLLMAEIGRGEASPWHSYIATLPEATGCLMTWSPDERKLLAGTTIEDKGKTPEEIFESDIAPLVAARPDLWPAAGGYPLFRRAAELVQSRAFHMRAENWVTGAVQESMEQLYLIPGMDMLNHSTDTSRRNTALERIKSAMTVEVEGVGEVLFEAFFTMKAERAIVAGEEVLHTYGDLSDAQLLQTYGFLEPLPEPNPHNYALIPYKSLLDGARRTLGGVDAAEVVGGKLLKSKEGLLAASGLLQAAAPGETEFVATEAEPLSDELLTAAQVLLMTSEEFEQLHAEQVPAGGGASGSSGASGSGSQAAAAAAARQRLSLGRDLLRGDFGELVGSTVLQACGLAQKRYPPPAAAPPPPGSRAALAARVADGEKAVLTAVKRAALMLLAEAAGDGDEDEDEGNESEDGGDSEDDGDDTDEDSEDDSEGKGEASEEAAAAEEEEAGGKGARRRGTKRAAGGGGGGGQQQPRPKRRPGLGSERARERRPHFGNLTGPTEEEVLESDDSDKVGYEEARPARGARHPPPGEHRYETAADGHTREVHGGMLGPDEEEVMYSEDSDKVGYA